MGLRHKGGRLILSIVDPRGELGRDDRTATMSTHKQQDIIRIGHSVIAKYGWDL